MSWSNDRRAHSSLAQARLLWFDPPYAVAALAVCVCACATSPGRVENSGSAGRLTVFAAASLADAFKAEAVEFQRQQPGTTIGFSFAGSSTLAAQIAQGAPADVFASADPANMDRLAAAHELLRGPVGFARNRLEL